MKALVKNNSKIALAVGSDKFIESTAKLYLEVLKVVEIRTVGSSVMNLGENNEIRIYAVQLLPVGKCFAEDAYYIVTDSYNNATKKPLSEKEIEFYLKHTS